MKVYNVNQTNCWPQISLMGSPHDEKTAAAGPTWTLALHMSASRWCCGSNPDLLQSPDTCSILWYWVGWWRSFRMWIRPNQVNPGLNTTQLSWIKPEIKQEQTNRSGGKNLIWVDSPEPPDAAAAVAVCCTPTSPAGGRRKSIRCSRWMKRLFAEGNLTNRVY